MHWVGAMSSIAQVDPIYTTLGPLETASKGVARWVFRSPAIAPGTTGFDAFVEGAGYSLSFSADHMAEDSLKRALGCVALALMPARGLDDALTGLRDCLSFHDEARDLEYIKPVSVVGLGAPADGGDDY
jgi:hypothetical protein